VRVPRRLLVVLLVLTAAPAAAQVEPDVTTTDERSSGGLSLSLFAVPYMGQDITASVVIGVEVQGLRDLPTRAAGPPRQLEMRYSLSAGDADLTRSAPLDRTLQVPLTGEMVGRQHVTNGVRLLVRFALAPGSYHVRATAVDTADGRSVTGGHHIDVTDLRPNPITVSGMLLSSSSVAGFTYTEVDADRMLPIVGQPPTARREFSPSEKLEVHAEFYENFPDTCDFDRQINVTTRLRSTDGTVLWETTDLGTSEALDDGRFGYAHSQLVPIRDLAPGQYIVEVGAETLYEVRTYVSRSAPITITSQAQP
jgi:hypothetical protein